MEVAAMQLMKHDPFESWFGSMLPEFFGRRAAAFSPTFDLAEEDKAYTLEAELPGLTDKDVKVSIEDGLLTISGEKKCESERKSKNFLHIERRYGSFSRSFELPKNVDADKIEARCKNGVLTVTLPKLTSSARQWIDVKGEE
jgi:HSP20 family protein